MQPLQPKTECKDGFKMSVQASAFHYCTPREDGLKKYETVEVGFPSEKEELLMEYVEDADNPTDTVYPYVPSDVVDKVIEKHGGIK